MVAPQYRENASGIRELSFFHLFDPGTIYAQWNIVFRLAGDCASVTSNTLSVVDNKSELHEAAAVMVEMESGKPDDSIYEINK